MDRHRFYQSADGVRYRLIGRACQMERPYQGWPPPKAWSMASVNRPDPEDIIGLDDGLYRVETNILCAGFVVKDNVVVACAPILRKRLKWYWVLYAKKVAP